MKGDFSQWQFDHNDNFNNVLHQQGRVLLDSDWNAQALILNDWQDTAARDAIGAGVAAVPAETPDAFQVIAANVDEQVTVTLRSGHLWADGLLIHLDGDQDEAGTPIVDADGSPIAHRLATYLQPPIQDPPGEESAIANTVRDAVILEIWREAVNGFQLPEKLIEPALGGLDTTERVHTAMALRLFRLGDEETCDTIQDQLKDNFNNRGKLKVSLQPPTTIDGDCPVVEGGGYTGFEHYLYRVEIARVNSPASMFKWSQFNGGLVGRGDCDLGGADKSITITHNDQAIKMSGLTNFYLEVVEWDAIRGHWHVIYGADVTLNDDELTVATERYTETPLPSGNHFFRLWNGIAAIADFPIATPGSDPVDLLDGIRLEFETPGTGKYVPGDYWTFIVRAGDIQNPEILIDSKPPAGIQYHRVPLAELTWNGSPPTSLDEEQIEDCRKPFRPLTNQKGCCSFSVGDGIVSRGDFNSIEDALKHLPPEGGRICILPGRHAANVTILNRRNIQITGCGIQTIVHPRQTQANQPIFKIAASEMIQLDHLTLMTNTGTAIQVIDIPRMRQGSRRIYILHNHIVACIHAIEIRLRLESSDDEEIEVPDRTQRSGRHDIWIAYNRIGMLDKEEGKAAIFSIADDVLIERNRLVVVPAPNPDDPNDPRDPDDPDGVFDPCADAQLVYTTRYPIYRFLQATFLYIAAIAVLPSIVYKAQGGIQIGGGSEDVKIIGNIILGGRGDGITLGDLPTEGSDDPVSDPAIYAIARLPDNRLEQLQQQFHSFLYQIAIEDNTIRHMGRSGIGVVAFLSIEAIRLMVSVEDLTIYRNHITHCARQVPTDIPQSMLDQIGIGGIALASCENAIIQENRIEENGLSHVFPICGIFILLGEKIDISNNRILNNSPRTSATDDIRQGLRGGIVIKMGFKASSAGLLSDRELLSPDGIPAIKIHSNIITQPLGQALFLMAFGPVTVVGNHLTSQGADARVNPFSLLAGAAFILNLGISKDLVGVLLLNSFKYTASTNIAGVANATAPPNDTLALLGRLLFLPSGTVLFANNQVNLDLRQRDLSATFSSQLIASLDDVAYNSNQSECNSFSDNVLTDVVLTDVAIFAVTVRSNNNRFQEGITFAVYSLFSYGLMNTATSNQATHCLLILGNPAFTIDSDNLILVSTPCQRAAASLKLALAVPEASAVG